MRTAILKRTVTGVAAALLACFLPALAHGGGVVTNTIEAALRAAMAGGGTVYFATTGTVVLASTITVSSDVSLIDSNRSVVISRSTNSQGSLFVVNPGVEFRAAGMTLANGRATNGGAIYSAGTVVLTDCLFSNNTAAGNSGALGTKGSFGTVLGTSGGPGGEGMGAAGGAVYSVGAAFIGNCTFVTNQAIGGAGGTGGTGGPSSYQGGDGGSGGKSGSAAGGALYSTGLLQVSNTLFRFNSARGGNGGAGGTNGAAPHPGATGEGGAGNMALGGALFATSGALLGCTFHGNAAAAGNSADAAGDTRNLIGLVGNQGPDAYGGGIYAEGVLEVVNCTFATNSAAGGQGGQGGNGNPYAGDGGAGGNAWGGSIYGATGATLGVTNCTIAAGAAVPGAAGARGGILAQKGAAGVSRGANLANAGSFVLKNTILAYPTNSASAYGAFVDALGNLSSDGTPSNLSNSRLNLDPLLLPLGNNGGPTPTIGLKTASPAVNAGDCAGVPLLDQRGYPRDGNCDVGAFELQNSVSPALSVASSKNQLLLSWPARASHYSVWTARNSLSSAWRPVTNTVNSVGDILTLAMPITLTNVQFFRLEAQ